MSKAALLRTIVLVLLMQGTSPGLAGKYDAPSPPPVRVWTIRNQCHEPVRVAVNYQMTEGRVVTRGWWRILPRGEATLEMRSEWIGYFAVSTSEKYFWSKPDGAKFGLDPSRDFEYPGDGQRQGATVTGFHWISVIRQPVTTLTCE